MSKKTCCICGNQSRVDAQYYLTANEWVWQKVNIERMPMDKTMIRVNEYGYEFPNKRFCPTCFQALCEIFR